MIIYSLSAALTSQLLIKEKSDAMIAIRHDQMIKMALTQIESDRDIDKLPCLIPLTSVMSMSLYSAHWWQTYGCRIDEKNQPYYFTVEFMGDDNCALLSNIDQHYVDIASYYRITLVDVDDLAGLRGVMVQSTIVLPRREWYQCAGNSHRVNSGRQMMRQ